LTVGGQKDKLEINAKPK